jgi:hypothetical protein
MKTIVTFFHSINGNKENACLVIKVSCYHEYLLSLFDSVRKPQVTRSAGTTKSVVEISNFPAKFNFQLYTFPRVENEWFILHFFF